MPQMAPLMWMNLFTLFVSIFLIFNSFNYFSFMYKALSTKSKFIKKNSNWKW
uniref:ATP synthase complex subunit 8 n=1 Tax=Elateroidea sp. 9 KM-2017 TaxID=2219432 RepID=A0A346RJ36_9COLE|nr:ATP synthase F0 subunit 8 [Elateroidea sp. 9 KM-2017]